MKNFLFVAMFIFSIFFGCSKVLGEEEKKDLPEEKPSSSVLVEKPLPTIVAEKPKEAPVGKSLHKYLYYNEYDQEAPEYRKVFDEYILDLEHLRRTGSLPNNPKKDLDLSQIEQNSVSLKRK